LAPKGQHFTASPAWRKLPPLIPCIAARDSDLPLRHAEPALFLFVQFRSMDATLSIHDQIANNKDTKPHAPDQFR
jgi:hypothetical protein